MIQISSEHLKKYNLPVDYDSLKPYERRMVREQYIDEQKGLCYFCDCPLHSPPPEKVKLPIDWDLFPDGFLNSPIHLQHDHFTGLTEGAVHAYCNAVMWQHYGR